MNGQSKRQAITGFGLLALLMAMPMYAKKRATDASNTQGVLHVTTQLVQVNVIVDDKHGQPVAGLTSDDFRILDDGEPQKISLFKVEQSQTAAPVTLPPGIFSNMPERQTGASPSVTVILLDGLNTNWADQAQARLRVIEFLRQLRPGDRVALYSLGTKLGVLHDFTSDSAVLLRALDHYRGHNGTELASSLADDPDNPSAEAPALNQAIADAGENDAAVGAALQAWVGDANNIEAEYYMNQRVAMTVDALVAIAQHLQGVPGRKNLVWVSAAFPILRGMDQMMQSGDFSRGTTYNAEISQAALALNDVNLAIYPVDARGLMVDPNYSVQSLSVNQVRAKGMRAVQQPTLPAHLNDNFPTMDQFAKRTGGRAFYNTNDIQGSIRRVLEDSRLTYLLAYYPAGEEWDGKFHKIKVEVDRPGVRLQYRDGYAAVPEARPTVQEGKKALDAALLSPLDATAVACVVKPVLLKTPAAQPPAVEMQYWIDPRNIILVPGRGGWQGHVTLTIVELGPRGENLKGLSHEVDLHLNATTREHFLASGLRYNEPLPIVPGAERIRVVVRDDVSNEMGSLSVPLSGILPKPPG